MDIRFSLAVTPSRVLSSLMVSLPIALISGSRTVRRLPVAGHVARRLSHGPCYPGQLAAPPMAFIGLKFYKTYSASMREMLYKSVGQNHSYMEHGGLKKFMSGGLRSLIDSGRVSLSKSPCGTYRPSHNRVAFFAFLREPASRWLSMLNMVYRRQLQGVSCDKYTPELLEPYFANDLLMGVNPYATVFGCDSIESVPRALAALKLNFVVGTDKGVTEFLVTLARLSGTNETDFFSRNLIHEHDSGGGYCSLARLPNFTQGFLRGRMTLDHALYRGASEIGHAQARDARPPPMHVVRDLLSA